MIKITIDGKTVNIEDGATLLDAARSAGIDIPTMCHRDKNVSPVSCFVCAVRVGGSDNFVPSCATKAIDGMVVYTSSDEVKECRRRALELMLSEHAGDCAAPCSRICPCGLDIPEMMRRLLSGDINTAAETIMRSMPLPATLGYICPAPCQKGCRRTAVDTPLSIQLTHRAIAKSVINTSSHNKTIGTAQKFKNIAIIGSGPAGLSSAYFLTVNGYSCTIFESQPAAGGTLRTQFDESALPKNILDAEIKLTEDLGVKFILNKKINSIDEIYNDYDAVVIATGHQENNQLRLFDLEQGSHGVKTCHDTLMTSRQKVFACGSAVRPVHMAARSVGQGKLTAASIDNYLSGKSAHKPFFMNIGHLSDAETESLVESIPYTDKSKTPLSIIDAITDNPGRCLQCDCGKKNSCVLRDYAAQYGAHRLRYATGHRRQYIRQLYAGSGLVHEPGKCTVCGRCVNITREKGIIPGLSFTGRGSSVYISAPFSADIDKAMGAVLDECVKSCPVGALWFKQNGGSA
ncbi:MAG: 2Fe-2S iron-sulfur cluster-binding protein [Chitinispirillia bacterium]|nr:2Fe-2S iron-sulfur cluster-binding protein [Chitinispirillia bacterium]MCL2269106.1 2Fe-2S iron-sulfur cluster-binding protein [Chitinispirillia bacterium]